jgi:hypothetical protein
MTTQPTFPIVEVTRQEMLECVSDAHKEFYGFRPDSGLYERIKTWDDNQLRGWLAFLGRSWISKEQFEWEEEQRSYAEDHEAMGACDWS